MLIIQKRLYEVLQLQQASNLITDAVNLNMQNLQEVLAEPDTEKRVNMIAKMRANMVDVAGINTKTTKLTSDAPENNLVVLYPPDNGQ